MTDIKTILDATDAQIEKELAETTFGDINKLTDSRATTHGKFSDHARITQRLKGVIHDELRHRQARKQPPLTFKELEAIEMIFHKIGRVVAGESSFRDHWDDIAGYATLPNKDV